MFLDIKFLLECFLLFRIVVDIFNMYLKVYIIEIVYCYKEDGNKDFFGWEKK